jgi:hypothetical protein
VNTPLCGININMLIILLWDVAPCSLVVWQLCLKGSKTCDLAGVYKIADNLLDNMAP